MADITVSPAANITVEVKTVASAKNINFSSATGLLSSTNLQDAVDELEERKFVGTAAPAASITDEGDIWYDSDDDKTYVRKDNEWVEMFDTESTIDGGSWQ